jgi:hypothetical protein
MYVDELAIAPRQSLLREANAEISCSGLGDAADKTKLS